MNINRLACLVISFCLSAVPSVFANSDQPLTTVEFVDLNRYLGEWYEIASFPQRFQKDCVASKATYSKRDENTIDVVNECRLKTFDGERKVVRGVAKIVDKKTNAKLKVSFFWPIFGKYWIIDLGRDYEYAVVGHPNRKYLWVLSRTKSLDQQTLDGILARVKEKGFDLSKLNMTLQPTN